MTETTESRSAEPADPAGPPDSTVPAPSGSHAWLRVASILACVVLGFVLVAQFQASENLGERLDIEREEDLAQILADLSTQSDRLQEEITSLRLTLLAFENSAESEDLALRSLQQRLDELRVLAGTVAVEGEGVRITVQDPERYMTQDLLVDSVQELRDAGAEAIAVNETRLVASSSFTTRNGKLVLDDVLLEPPFVVTAIGPSDTISKALTIPGGALDSLQSRPQVTAVVEVLEELTIPPRREPVTFVYGDPIPPDTGQ